jgi:hypothetical protein
MRFSVKNFQSYEVFIKDLRLNESLFKDNSLHEIQVLRQIFPEGWKDKTKKFNFSFLHRFTFFSWALWFFIINLDLFSRTRNYPIISKSRKDRNVLMPFPCMKFLIFRASKTYTNSLGSLHVKDSFMYYEHMRSKIIEEALWRTKFLVPISCFR